MIGVQAGLHPIPGAGGSRAVSGVAAAFPRLVRSAYSAALAISTISTMAAILVMATASGTVAASGKATIWAITEFLGMEVIRQPGTRTHTVETAFLGRQPGPATR